MPNANYSMLVNSDGTLVYPSLDVFKKQNDLSTSNKQDKLKYYSETDNSANINSNYIKLDSSGSETHPNIELTGSQTTINGLDTKIYGSEVVSIESDGDININNTINTNGIHEQCVYDNTAMDDSFQMNVAYFCSNFKFYTDENCTNEIPSSKLNINYFKTNNVYGRVAISSKLSYHPSSAISPDDANDKEYDTIKDLTRGDVLTFKNDYNFIDAVEVVRVENSGILVFKYKLDKIPLGAENTNKDNEWLRCMKQVQPYTTPIPITNSIRCYARPTAIDGKNVSGKYSTSIGGGGSDAKGYLATTIGGRSNKNYGDFSVVIGENNELRSKSGVAIGGKNQILGENSYTLGVRNVATNWKQTLIGSDNKAENPNTYMLGTHLRREKNDSYLSKDQVIIGVGTAHTISGGVEVSGYKNTDLDASCVIACGNGNAAVFGPYECRAEMRAESVVCGYNNTYKNDDDDKIAKFTFMFGRDLTRTAQLNSTDITSQVILGRYNEDKAGKSYEIPCFVIANGIKSAPHNAIEIYDKNAAPKSNSNAIKLNGESVSVDGKFILPIYTKDSSGSKVKTSRKCCITIIDDNGLSIELEEIK